MKYRRHRCNVYSEDVLATGELHLHPSCGHVLHALRIHGDLTPSRSVSTTTPNACERIHTPFSTSTCTMSTVGPSCTRRDGAVDSIHY